MVKKMFFPQGEAHLLHLRSADPLCFPLMQESCLHGSGELYLHSSLKTSSGCYHMETRNLG